MLGCMKSAVQGGREQRSSLLEQRLSLRRRDSREAAETENELLHATEVLHRERDARRGRRATAGCPRGSEGGEKDEGEERAATRR